MSYIKIVPDRDRPDGWKVLELAGIPVYIEPSYLLFMGLIALMNMQGDGIDVSEIAIIAVAIFLSLLVHEFGHALTAKLCGCKRIFIALRMFGGYATHTPTSRGKSLLIVLMGPAFGFMLFLLAFVVTMFVQEPHPAIDRLLGELLWMNFFWTIFNLLPIYPLDGGQALFHTLTFWKYDDDSLIWTARVSMVVAALTGLWAYSTHQMFTGLFCLSFFMTNLQIVQTYSGSRWR